MTRNLPSLCVFGDMGIEKSAFLETDMNLPQDFLLGAEIDGGVDLASWQPGMELA